MFEGVQKMSRIDFEYKWRNQNGNKFINWLWLNYQCDLF